MYDYDWLKLVILLDYPKTKLGTGPLRLRAKNIGFGVDGMQSYESGKNPDYRSRIQMSCSWARRNSRDQLPRKINPSPHLNPF